MLKHALAANSAFSTVSGLALIVLRDALSAEIPAPPWFFAATGVGLLAFAAQLVLMVAKPALARRLAMQVIAADAAWVVLTSVALVAFFARVSAIGVALIVAVNAIVAVLALLQFRGLASEQRRAA